MRSREYQAAVPIKPETARVSQAGARPAEAGLRRGPLAGAAALGAGGAGVAEPAAALRGATGGRLARAGPVLAQLQLRRGSRYVQTLVGRAQAAATAQAAQLSGAARAPGRPLPAAVRDAFGSALGADLSGVRIHTGDQAARLSRGLGAEAFTRGSDIFFGTGRYAPATPPGRRLLAHELTHVLQQRRGAVEGSGGRGLLVSRPSDAYERAAEATARRVTSAPVSSRQDSGLSGGDPPAAARAAGPAPAIQRYVTIISPTGKEVHFGENLHMTMDHLYILLETDLTPAELDAARHFLDRFRGPDERLAPSTREDLVRMIRSHFNPDPDDVADRQ